MSLEEREALQQKIIDEDDGEWEKELDARNRKLSGIDEEHVDTASHGQHQTGGKESGGKNYEPYDNDNPRDVLAAKEYRKISRRNDLKTISNNSGMTVSDIRKIKRHIFFNKHKLYEGYRVLYPDYDMAVAWKRLYEGKPEERDFLLLKHELLESELEKEYNLTIAEAHKMAKEKYDWEQALTDAVGDLGEPDGLL